MTRSVTFLLLGAALTTVAEATPMHDPTITAPIAVEVRSGSPDRRGILNWLLSDFEGDTRAAARDVERALGPRHWLETTTDEGEVVVGVTRRQREELSRSYPKDGGVKLTFRYVVRAGIAVPGDHDRLEATTTFSRTFDENASHKTPSWREDDDAYARAAHDLATKICDWILDRIDSIRPGGSDPGFRHQPKYKWLVKGDGLEVVAVLPGSPADRQGLRVGDRIRAIDGERGTAEMSERTFTWRLEPAGTRVVIEVERNRRRRAIELELTPPAEWDVVRGRDEPAPARPADEERASEGGPQRIDLAKGMTTDEVEAMLGKPLKIASLGSKVIWIYDDFGVTFVNGVTTDIGDR